MSQLLFLLALLQTGFVSAKTVPLTPIHEPGDLEGYWRQVAIACLNPETGAMYDYANTESSLNRLTLDGLEFRETRGLDGWVDNLDDAFRGRGDLQILRTEPTLAFSFQVDTTTQLRSGHSRGLDSQFSTTAPEGLIVDAYWAKNETLALYFKTDPRYYYCDQHPKTRATTLWQRVVVSLGGNRARFATR